MIQALYQEALVAMAREACGAKRREHPDGSALVDNPLCGDQITLDVNLDAATVSAIGHRVRGCLLCEASASWIAKHAVGAEAKAIAATEAALRHLLEHGDTPPGDFWPDLQTFSPVHNAKSRRRCVMLPFEALNAALADAKSA